MNSSRRPDATTPLLEEDQLVNANSRGPNLIQASSGPIQSHVASRTSLSAGPQMDDERDSRDGKRMFFLQPLRLPENMGASRVCCERCCERASVCCNNCWFFGACFGFFIWSSLPRVNTLVDFIVCTLLYCDLHNWNYDKMRFDIEHFSFRKSRIDIVALSLIRSIILFFVFSYRNHREWYHWNLAFGVFIAVGSTTYGALKVFLLPGDQKTPSGGDTPTVDGKHIPVIIVFFVAWVWFECLIFGCVRRKKIRIPKIPNMKNAYGALRRNVHSTFTRFRNNSDADSDIEDGRQSLPKSSSYGGDGDANLKIDPELSYFSKDAPGVVSGPPHTGILPATVEPRHRDSATPPSAASFPHGVPEMKSSPGSLRVRRSAVFSGVSHVPDSEFSKHELPLRTKTSQFLKIGDVSVHFRVNRGRLPWDKGPVFLLLHGFGGGIFSWEPSWELLRNQCSLILAFDRPGFGLTTRLMRPFENFNPYEMGFTVDVCKRLVNHLELEKVVVIGHGSGCLVANHFAAKHPTLVESMVLLTPTFHAPPLMRGLLKTRLGKAVITQLLKTEMTKMTIRRGWHHPEDIPESLEHKYFCSLELENWDNAIWEMLQTDLAPQEELVEEFARLKLSTLVLHGKADRVADLLKTEEMVDLWRKAQPSREISFITLDNVGHVIHEEFPVLFTKEVKRFLYGEDPAEQIEDEDARSPNSAQRTLLDPPSAPHSGQKGLSKISSASKELLVKVVGGGKSSVKKLQRAIQDSISKTDKESAGRSKACVSLKEIGPRDSTKSADAVLQTTPEGGSIASSPGGGREFGLTV